MTSAAQLFEQGFTAHQSGDLDSAARSYDAALALSPSHARTLHLRGVVHLQRQEGEAAVEMIRRSLAIDASDASAYGNLASALLAIRRIDEAVVAARRGVTLNPAAADIWANLGTALSRRKSYHEALEAYERAASLQPERAGLHSQIGICLGRLERYDEALISHRRAMALAPERPEYRNNLSVTLRRMALFEDAEVELRAALEGGLDDADLKASLGLLLYRRGKTFEAIKALDGAAQQHGPSNFDQALRFVRNYVGEDTVEAQREQARKVAEAVCRQVTRFDSHGNSPDPARRIRVGLVSSDFRRHPVALFLVDVLRVLDPSVVELYAYSGFDSKDDMAQVLRAIIPNWRSTAGWSDLTLARRVRDDGIDILVDLSGPTAGGRAGLFAMQPAPVSFGWLGYSGTTGLPTVDYVLGDAEVLPPGVNQLVETPWLMPDAYLCFSPQDGAPDVGPPPAVENGFVTFGTLNNTSKISARTLDTWARVLKAVPDSRLMLKARHVDKTGEDARMLTTVLSQRGVAEERVTVLPWADGWLQHLPSYHRFDIGLDTFPYNGTTTTCESLLMGVPVVTLRGDRFISRVGASILHQAGLDDWIAESPDMFVDLAAHFASDLVALSKLRQELRPRFVASPMCDAPRFARNFEAALRGMWQKWCNAAR